MKPDTALPEQFGRYRILKKLGEGGMGAVYLAEDTQLRRRVALKVPHFAAEDGAEAIQRFQREARVAAGIEHPNLCGVYDVGQVGGVHYFTMSYIEGTTLARLVGPERPWPPRQAAALVCKLALAVEAVHQRGVIHRDLKPGNVLVRPDGEPVLMDFGLARSFKGRSGQLTSAGMVVGTPVYMAPEQIEGDPTGLGPGTDIYSLGVLLYELVTGRPPFEGPVVALFAQILRTAPAPPSALWPGLDPQIDALCLKALAKRPEDRFATAQEFASVLERYAQPQLPAPAGKPPRAPGQPEETGTSRVVCPSCGQRTIISVAQFDKQFLCPKCRTPLPSPAPPDNLPIATLLPTARPLPPAPRPRGKQAEFPIRSRSGNLFVVCLAGLVLVVGLVLGWLSLSGGDRDEDGPRRAAPHRKDTPDDVKKRPDSRKGIHGAKEE